MPTGSWTGWLRPDSHGGRSCRWGRPTTPARPTCRPRRSRARPPSSPTGGRPSSPRRPRRSASRTPTGSTAGSGTAARSTTRSGSSANGAGCARYAAERGVRIFGDIPIYVAQNGADHRAHPELFQRDGVAGVPPDAFSATGQLWGNPLYDWGAMRADGYRWWIERLRRMFELVDLVRVDHFRGFVSYWAVPSGSTTAAGGRWRRGPGRRALPGADGRARAAAGRGRGSRRDHGAGRAPPPRVRPAGHGRCSSSRSGTTRRTRTSRRTTRSSRSSTPARTTTTRRSAGGTPSRTRSARRRTSIPPTPRGRVGDDGVDLRACQGELRHFVVWSGDAARQRFAQRHAGVTLVQAAEFRRLGVRARPRALRPRGSHCSSARPAPCPRGCALLVSASNADGMPSRARPSRAPISEGSSRSAAWKSAIASSLRPCAS